MEAIVTNQMNARKRPKNYPDIKYKLKFWN